MIKCPNCGQELPDQTKFCRYCGSGIAQAPAQAPAYAETNYYAEQPNNYADPYAANAYADPYATDANGAAAQKSPIDSIKEIINKIPKKFLIAGVAVVLVIAIIIGIVSIAGGGKDDFVLYYKDGELFFSDFSGKPMQITDDLELGYGASPKVTKDSKTIFYIDDDAKLYYRSLKNEKKDPEKLANDVSSFYISANGKKVIYSSDGNLYLHDLKQSEKIAKDVETFIISLDLKKVYYTNDENEFFYLKVGKDATKIASDVNDFSASANFKYALYSKSVEAEDAEDSEYEDDYDYDYGSTDLYVYKEGGEGVKVDSDASVVGVIYDSGKFYYYTESEEEDDYSKELCFYNGKEGVVVSESFNGGEAISADKPILVYSEIDAEDEDAEETYAIAKEEKVIAFNAENIANLQLAEDNKTIYYTVLDETEGEEEESEDEYYEDDYSYEEDYEESKSTYTLYKTTISGNSVKEAKTIDTEVESSSFVLMGSSKVAYEKDDNGLFINGEKVIDDVVDYYYYKPLKTLYIESDKSDDETFTLSTSKGKKAKKVADDVSTFNITESGKLYYITDINKNGEGSLYLAKGNKPKKIDDDVTSLASNGRSDGKLDYGEMPYYGYYGYY